MFLAGGAFGYVIAFPRICEFLIGFGERFDAMLTIDKFFTLEMRILLSLAVIFELPVVTVAPNLVPISYFSSTNLAFKPTFA